MVKPRLKSFCFMVLRARYPKFWSSLPLCKVAGSAMLIFSPWIHPKPISLFNDRCRSPCCVDVAKLEASVFASVIIFLSEKIWNLHPFFNPFCFLFLWSKMSRMNTGLCSAGSCFMLSFLQREHAWPRPPSAVDQVSINRLRLISLCLEKERESRFRPAHV